MSIGAPSYRDSNTETLSGTKTLTFNDARTQVLAPGGGNRNVVLPAETNGIEVFISNTADASENLVVQEDGASTTIVTISQDEDAVLTSDGSGWVAVLSKGAT